MDKYSILHKEKFYLPMDPMIVEEQKKYLEKLAQYNKLGPYDEEKKESLLKEMFAEIGENCYIEVPFRANWGGRHVHFGKHVYANFNLTLVDDTHIYVGDHTMIGPNVTIATASHPLWPDYRKLEYQANHPVHIGENCWLGAGVIVLPGITIGKNVVVGAGSVVTKDLPDNVVAVGNPCRILREITEKDREDIPEEL